VSGLDLDAPLFLAGHRGLAGGAILRALEARGHRALVTRSSADLDLRDREAVFAFFAESRPVHVVLAAARVGGIGANVAEPFEFLSDNLRIQTNVMDAALAHDVDRLLFLGSSCIYPRTPRAHQRGLRRRQDRGDPRRAGGPARAPASLDLGDAGQPLRPR